MTARQREAALNAVERDLKRAYELADRAYRTAEQLGAIGPEGQVRALTARASSDAQAALSSFADIRVWVEAAARREETG